MRRPRRRSADDGDPRGSGHAHRRAHRLGQDARGVPRGLDALVHRADTGELGEGIDVVYVSPLKALSSDVEKNLAPLSPASATRPSPSAPAAGDPHCPPQGDTTAAARAAIVRKARTSSSRRPSRST